MTIIRIRDKEFELRPADPEKDSDWAYSLFKKTSMKFVKELAGRWPEKFQHNFFNEVFCKIPIQIIMYDGAPIGFYGIAEEDNRIHVQRLYVAQQWQGKGIGGWVLDEALKMAHNTHKPLEMEALTSNRSAMDIYEHKGFKIVGANTYDWVREHILRHRDTEQYALQRTNARSIAEHPGEGTHVARYQRKDSANERTL